ncbi:dTDP-glucose 4,6-dehydratase [Euzebyella marina]|uniref:dTDP-glucose 4,6-dehydratase n=1 Tax=Euzebyella marina TaxID=1761453 RepID=A0A3G2L1F1_9FLAO|nr:dTDP-glucose 4,6-dehydratase [Euzebyella marina]AYN66082.1 dTDP-glucose 4,6-dehydratase [Euzebyella marina]
MKTQKILITGGAGFIGSNFIPYFLQKNKSVDIINLDKLTYAGNLQNLQEVEKSDRYEFYEGDICDDILLNEIFIANDITGIIHFAAESHVDNSISGPSAFIKTNIRGTFSLLEAARKNWLSKEQTPNPFVSSRRFLHVSTDEVFGSLGQDGFFTEESPYRPNSPYSASKASSDFLVRSYHHTYGLNTLISNCSNNYGPKQHGEKLIPTIIRKALNKEPIPIYGDGKNVRDWLYVMDHCAALSLIYQKGQPGESYVIGGNNECSNIHIAKEVCQILDEEMPLSIGSYSNLITFVKDRPGHDFRYAIDASKVENILDWKSETNFSEGLRKTIKWYINRLEL